MSVRKPKVVVIDDSEVVLEFTRGALEGAGFDVVTHDRPGGCVALILHEKPDLVLMDVNMPGLAGDTVAGVLAKAQPTRETVILLYSSLSADALRAKAAAAGAHGFIQKTGDTYGFVRDLNRWLKRGGPGALSSGHMRAALPVSDDGRPSGTRIVAAGAVPTLLLVDDDMSVLSGYRRHLSSDAFSIEFALSGGQALRRLSSEKPPTAVICDIVLPDTSGMEVYEHAVKLDPSYQGRFAFATGAANMRAVAGFLARFTGPVLQKPVDPEKLLAAVRACLGGAPSLSRSRARS